MRLKNFDLILTITIAVLDAAWIVFPISIHVLESLLTLPLVFVLPGYALTSALFPRKTSGAPERILFCLGVNLTVIILGGLVLNWTPSGLQTNSWSVLLSSITIGASIIALVERRGQKITTSTHWQGWKKIGLTFRQWWMLSIAIVILWGAIVVSTTGAAQQSFSGFTQLWLLPVDGAHPQHTVRLGINNQEQITTAYNLVLRVNNKIIKTWTSIILKSNEKWEIIFALSPTMYKGVQKVEALLYRRDTTLKIYRHVLLWLIT